MPTPMTVPLADLIAEAGPHRVLTVRRLVELGVPPRTISRRTAPAGPWTPLLRGVVLLSGGPATWAQKLAAAQAYGGPSSVISGFAATRAHGLLRGPRDDGVLLLVDHACHVSSQGFVTVERTTRLPGHQERDGLRLAPVTRAVLDGARRLTVPDEVRAVVAEAVQRRRTTPSRLAGELGEGSCRGTALVRTVLAEVADGVRSVAEGWGRDAMRGGGLPEPLWNPQLFDASGLLAVPDAYWEEVGLAWQIDSREWHLNPESWAETLRIRSVLQSAGVLVVSTAPQRLRDERAAVLEELATMYALAAQLPRPALSVTPVCA